MRLLPIPPRGPEARRPSWPHALTLLCPLSAGGQQPLAGCSVPLELSTAGILRPHSQRPALASFADLCVPSCHKAAHRPPCPGPFLSCCLPVTVSPSPILCHHLCSDDSQFPSPAQTPSQEPAGHSSWQFQSAFNSPWSRWASCERQDFLLPSSTSRTLWPP